MENGRNPIDTIWGNCCQYALCDQVYCADGIHIMIVQYSDVIQFVKYVIAGGIATISHIIVFHLAAWKFFPALLENDYAVKLFRLKLKEINNYTRAWNSMISNCIAFLISNLIAYILNVLWVFQRGQYSVFLELILFYIVSGVSMVLGTALMGLLIRRYKLMTSHAFVANLIAAVLVNFYCRKYIIFY